MTQEEVDSFLKENKISVSVMMEQGYDKDDEYVDPVYDDEGYFEKHGEGVVKIEKSWGFSSPNGFHTFTGMDTLEEKEAQYMTALFHILYEEYGTDWNSAEALAYSYVKTCNVPYEPPPPMTEEEQEAVRKQLLDCIDSGNLVIPKGNFSDDEVKEYVDKVAELEKEDLFTKPGVVKDWKIDASDPHIVTENERFYWYDDHGLDRNGPYDSVEEAIESMQNYKDNLEKTKK